ncbi:adenosylmethionine decarboxylase [Aeropyrum camini]|uniref:Arginine decarboxylase proenzyme n=1 Tax=Aeropyrum camini SY1 = JCM 12091 TaxID=1198449 RepID=U3TDU1_9CREN|nr:adenosylmethionine decarboxylase [Aeropyrum camini]BAN89529.1 S-adenosylmethionine decarboxylase proenzyme [Aeropyrum camini SY1 = JCM 12091]
MERRDEIIVGKHVYGSLYGVPLEKATDEEYLRGVVVRAAEAAGATVHAVNSWTIPGEKGGVSVIVLVLESHLALHTWPEYDYATFDIYTCGEHTDPWKAFELLLSELNPKRYTVHYVDRSQEKVLVEPQPRR